MDWFIILQWTVGLFFFANKVFLLAEMKAGWKIGLGGSVLAVTYFAILDLYVLALIEVALGLLFVYGLLVSLSSTRSAKARNIALVASFLTIPFVVWATYAGEMTILETLASVFMLIGFYFVAGNERDKVIFSHLTPTQFGWLVLAITHTIAAWLMRGYFTGQEFFADMQIASVVVCLVIVAQQWRKTTNLESYHDL